MKSLTGDVSLKVGPLVLEVLVKHWFDRLKKDHGDVEKERQSLGARLKEDDIFYHEAFVIAKEFLSASTSHTIEEIQSFSNTRTPSPPWVHVVRTIVPLSCCDEAATYLIKALGGEDVARQAVGGIKWWQVRGVNGVDAQWITMKKDWQEAKQRHKMRAHMGLRSPAPSTLDGTYDKDMDAMRCILYLHGGGYYFGSVDQTRYSTQRFARKINGRVFAINYRLAPQYPFPCGLHDALAAYLFLIRPPQGSDHVAINPTHIIISGDSAGGGLSLALLQVIRDAGLPLPGGGVLISPWCDLTHSFPSVHQNTKTDIIPESGLSFHKPSILWPPPSSDFSKCVHASLRFRIKQAFRMDTHISETSTIISEKDASHRSPLDSPSPSRSERPSPGERDKIVIKTATGENIEITDQLQFYTTNSLIKHPLVSPITGYLGGLPPLLFIVGDEEVLRDEIIYTAHKAAYPEKYPILPSSRLLCSHLQDVEKRFKEPTSVHLQVYDGTPHILPILFSFTTPAKFCYRAIANFDRFVTDMKVSIPMTIGNQSGSSDRPCVSRRKSLFASFKTGQSPTNTDEGVSRILDDAPVVSSPVRMASVSVSPVLPTRSSFRQVISTRAGSLLQRRPTFLSQESREDPVRTQLVSSDDKQPLNSSSDAPDSRFQYVPQTRSERTAGEPQVYEDIKDRSKWECRMIRERVSTSGVVRHLEPEDELTACKMPHADVAQFSEDGVRRYMRSKRKFDQQFQHTIKSIDKNRLRNLAKSKEDTIKRVTALQQSINQKESEAGEELWDDGNRKRPERHPSQSRPKFDQRVLSSPGWAWSWVLDELENPPPSSIVARRDTSEARQLAAIADWATRDEDLSMSGNNLWNVVQNFLIAPPDVKPHRKKGGGAEVPSADVEGNVKNRKETVSANGKKGTSIFAKASSLISKSCERL